MNCFRRERLDERRVIEWSGGRGRKKKYEGQRDDGGGRVAGDLREGSRDNSPPFHRATEELYHACLIPSPNPVPPLSHPSLSPLQIKEALLPLSVALLSVAFFFHKSVASAKTTHFTDTQRGCITKSRHFWMLEPNMCIQTNSVHHSCLQPHQCCCWHGFEVHQTHPVTTGGHILSKLTRETRIHSRNAGRQCISYS